MLAVAMPPAYGHYTALPPCAVQVDGTVLYPGDNKSFLVVTNPTKDSYAITDLWVGYCKQDEGSSVGDLLRGSCTTPPEYNHFVFRPIPPIVGPGVPNGMVPLESLDYTSPQTKTHYTAEDQDGEFRILCEKVTST